MASWDRSRDTIGQNRTWIIGRALAGAYFLVIGFWLMLLGLALAIIFAVVGGVYTLITNKPLNFGRTASHALFNSQKSVGLYALDMKSYPGIIPRMEDGKRR